MGWERVLRLRLMRRLDQAWYFGYKMDGVRALAGNRSA